MPDDLALATGTAARADAPLRVKGLDHVVLRVSDMDRAIAFYEQVLGFSCDYSAGQPLQFAICTRDGHAIMLRGVSTPELITPVEKQGGTWDAFFWVRDVRALHEELAGRGAEIVYGPIVQQAYNMEEFAVRDHNGYVLGFGQALG